jgi:hypothetical protein
VPRSQSWVAFLRPAKIWISIRDEQRYKRPTLRCYQKHVISKVFGDCYYHAVRGHSSISGTMVRPDNRIETWHDLSA